MTDAISDDVRARGRETVVGRIVKRRAQMPDFGGDVAETAAPKSVFAVTPPTLSAAPTDAKG